jgi:uncharacterized phage protein (TIGR02218 family)|tara:strand:- start:208589 stop:209446 length:858 start_codon:yes stop_codon:yes gene_type:complete
MKTFSPDLQAHLDSGATTLCHAWKLMRRDGTVMGFTDHDDDLTFDGMSFEAAAGFGASAVESSSGLAVDNLDILGALMSDRLSENDLVAGLFDNAEIEIWRVNWQDTNQRVLLRKGNLGEVTRGATGFTAELRGLAHRLNQPVGRLYQYGCDADLGDLRCGVTLAAASGTVLGAEDSRIITASGLDAYAEDWFTRGRLQFTSGANAGAAMEVRLHAKTSAGAVFDLWQAMPRDVEAGDTFSVMAGCDKQFSTCTGKFGNGDNFRGFPHMPGNDFVMSYPGGGGND